MSILTINRPASTDLSTDELAGVFERELYRNSLGCVTCGVCECAGPESRALPGVCEDCVDEYGVRACSNAAAGLAHAIDPMIW